jgi:hypothetical protein
MKDKEEKEEIDRNNLCPCGSGLKYKRCCGRIICRQLHSRDSIILGIVEYSEIKDYDTAIERSADSLFAVLV